MESDKGFDVAVDQLRREYKALLDWLEPILIDLQGLDASSTKHERELARIWSKWDTLESRRHQQDVGLGSMHKELATMRWCAKQTKYLKAMLAHEGDPKKFPLWTCIEHFVGSQAQELSQDLSTQSAEAYWNVSQVLVKNHPGFWGLLSRAQKATWQMMHDWWHAAYQNQHLAIAAQKAIHVLCSTPWEGLPVDPPDDILSLARAKDSLYHFSGFYLFWQEFNRSSWVPEAFDSWLPLLEDLRTCFVTQSRCQRIAYSFYAKFSGILPIHSSPYVDDPSSHCPWLADVDILQDRPYFLWEIETGRSVVVNELAQMPDYVCISHTWGRWRQPRHMDVTIEGVPWKVPTNSRFDVRTLPTQFMNMNLRYNYIWFDLFCIPQDESVVYWKQLADKEISRQSSIFRCSSMCMAWFNEVSDWSGLSKALDWMSALFLHKSARSGSHEATEMLVRSSKLAEVPVELMVTRLTPEVVRAIRDESSGQQIPDAEYEANIWPSPWFSSLWKLQEAVLCPSLILVNVKWEPFTDAAGSAVPLNALLSFISLCSILDTRPASHEPDLSSPYYLDYGIRSASYPAVTAWEKWPLGPQQTLKLCLLTRMQRLLEVPSSPFVFVLANLRQCTGDRAPAIMSALGVTDWYSDPTSPLVLGMYPLSFVREAAAKFGARFYAIFNHRVRNSNPVGTLLPFTKPQGWLTGAMDVREVSPLQPKDHPAVQTWIINANASVTIKKAGILAASGRLDPRDIQGSVGILVNNDTDCDNFTENILEWLSGLRKDILTFLVALSDDMYHQNGIILQGKGTSPVILAKIGSYNALEQPMPESEKVDWVVL